MADHSRSGRAVVIGGSLAGLLAARVLADRFDDVVLVERDALPDGPEPRKGVPQSRHLHVLLVRGQRLLEAFFPGLMVELREAGAATIHWPRDILWLGAAGWGSRSARGKWMVSARRELLEDRVRRRVLARPEVRLLQSTEAVGLVADADGRGVRALRIQGPVGDGRGDIEELEADLVVDASGSSSAAPSWLRELRYETPVETVVNSFLGYASRFYEPPPADGRDWTAMLFQPNAPQETRGAAMLPVDGGLWHVTVVGNARDYPPVEESAFLAFAGSLRSPALREALEAARPVSPIWAYRRTQNRLRDFAALRRWPDGFVVLGDAVCRFNPVYGQGMTIAAESALVLRRWLSSGEPALGFQRHLATMLKAPWLLATGEDLRYPTTEGARPDVGTRVAHRYLDRLIRRGRTDDVVADAFIRVVHLEQPPRTLFHPEIVTRVLAGPRYEPADGLGRAPRRPREVPSPVEAMPIPVREGFVEGDGGVRLHYVEAGEGPLVLLVHGFPEFWYSWRRQIPALVEAGYRTVAIDQRGYNLSDKPRGLAAYTVPTLAADVAAAIRGLGAESATIVAHDWGGGPAWRLAMDRPDLVERLAIANSPHPKRLLDAWRGVRQLRRSWYIGFYQLPSIPEAFMRWGDYESLRTVFRGGARPESFTDDDIERYREALSRPGALTAGLNYYRALRLPESRSWGRRARSEMPVLVVWGDRDPYLGADLAEPPADLVPDARVVHIATSGHWVHLDEADRVNRLLLDFLAANAPTARHEAVTL